MAALNFPDDRTGLVPAGTGPLQDGDIWRAPNGVNYTWNAAGSYWSATFQNDSIDTLGSTFLRLDTANAPLLGDLTIGAANQIDLATNGDASFVGNVGVGTTSARRQLHVHNTLTGTVGLMLTNAATLADNDSRGFQLKVGADKHAELAQMEDSYLSIFTNATEQMRIDSIGRVGIGAVPSDFSGDGDTLVLSNNGACGITIDATSATNSSIRFADGSTGNEAYRGYIVYKHSDDSMLIGTAAADQIKILSNGNVGIGSPSSISHKLCVNGNIEVGSAAEIRTASSTGQLRIQGGSTYPGGNILLGGGSGNDDIRFNTSGSSATNAERMRITSTGNVGIGSIDPADKLEVNGDIRLKPSTGANTLINFEYNSGLFAQIRGNGRNGDPLYGDLEFWTKGSTDSAPVERMVVDANGSVGIGVTSPSAVLHTSTNATDAAGLYLENRADAGASDAIGIVFGLRRAGGFAFSGTRIRAVKENAWTGTPSTINSALTFSTYNGETAGERLRITSAGLVGIGTQTPSHPLDVRGTNTQINFAATESGGGYLMSTNAGQWSISGGVRYNGAGWYARHTTSSIIKDDGDGNICFYTNTGNTLNNYVSPSERMRIFEDGGVGINLNSSQLAGAGNARLVVNVDSTAVYNATTNFNNHSVELTNRSSMGSAFMRFRSQANNGSAGIWNLGVIPYTNSTNSDFIFQTRTGDETYGERMRIKSTGDVGIGRTDPTYKLDVRDDNTYAARIGGSGGGDYYMEIGQGSPSSSPGFNATGTSTSMKFEINGTHVGRFDTNGNFLVGKESLDFAVQGVELRQGGEITLTRNGDLLTTRRLVSEGRHISIRSISGNDVGSVSTNGTNTSFNESSDYRLKENIVSLDNSIERLKELSPKRFNFISHPETTFDGFLAHEVHPVVPEAVFGEKDAVDDSGEMVIQQLDKSKLVPLLTAALQEAIAKIETLETKVAALEGN